MKHVGFPSPLACAYWCAVAMAAFFMSAVKVGAEVTDCVEGRTLLTVGDAVFCVPQDVEISLWTQGDNSNYLAHVKDFDAVEPPAPFGTADVTLLAGPFVPLDPDRLTASQRSAFGAFQDGRLSYLQPYELTLFNAPFLMRCMPALSPRLSEQGAEGCVLFAGFGATHMVKIRLTTVIWQDKPAWPALDDNPAETWLAPLLQLEQALTAFFVRIEQE